MPNRYIQPGDNPELTEDRQSCKFDTNELAVRIYGSRKIVEDRHRIVKAFESEPQLRNAIPDLDTAFMSRLEKFKNSYENTVLAEKFMDKIIDREDVDQYNYYQQLINGTNGHPFLLKHVIVIPLLENSSNDEQRKLFLEPAKRHEFSSAYAQTELGHGTNTKRLETTATYDAKTEEFVLNSPTTTSLKWWPGNLAKSASMLVLMADLRTNGRSYGMHPFFIRIRDQNTHELLPGVFAGEIGPTFANNTNDNGYIGFKNFRVPRISMLMKHFQVKKDGTYEAGIHPRLAYTGMMFVRASMPFEFGIGLAAGAIITTRYSLVRRQGEIHPGQGEVKILDYKTQQYRVLPQIARAICFCFAGHFSMGLYNKVMQDIKSGDVSQLAELHALTSGLKSVCSYQASFGVEQCRLACGGHGYSLASGMPQILTKLVAGCTYEGDNLVMLLQVARYLVKFAKEVRNGQKHNGNDGFVQYLYEKPTQRCNLSSKLPQIQQWTEIQRAFEHLARRVTLAAYDSLIAQKAKHPSETAWNLCSVQLTKAARVHTRTFLSRNFTQTVAKEQDQQIRLILEDLLGLYLYYELLECRADLLEDNYMTSTQLDEARDKLNEYLSRVRKNALNICDSFDIPDRVLCTVLGRRNGHVYENLLEWAKKSEPNQTSVLPFHHRTIGKLMRDRKMHSKI